MEKEVPLGVVVGGLGRNGPSVSFLRVEEGKALTTVSSLELALLELARASGALGTVQEFMELGGLCLQIGPLP